MESMAVFSRLGPSPALKVPLVAPQRFAPAVEAEAKGKRRGAAGGRGGGQSTTRSSFGFFGTDGSAFSAPADEDSDSD